LVPADRFFSAADQTRLTLKDRVAANALELARGGPNKAPFYLSGNVSGQPFSVHAEGEPLGVAPRTLRHWRQCRAKPPAPRGRPPCGCPVADRNEVIGFLHHVTGPSVGVPALRRLFPNVLPCILTELIPRYRRMWRRRYRKRGFQLNWRRAGVVWAMDHSKACYPIDGIYPYLLAVRDLGSKCQLAWHPCRTERAEEVIPVLMGLFEEHTPPFVLKSDNGSAFIAEETTDLSHRSEAAQLRSPARTPSYNGALERSNGTMKTHTPLSATREGHPLRWTTQNLEEARELVNTISRPWGHEGPAPKEAWDSRQRPTPEERLQFAAALAAHRLRVMDELGVQADEASADDRARVDRHAIRRTLEQLGYLELTRVHRAPKKPKRLSRDELQKRAQEHLGGERSSGAKPLAKSAAHDIMQASTRRDQRLLLVGVQHLTLGKGVHIGNQRKDSIASPRDSKPSEVHSAQGRFVIGREHSPLPVPETYPGAIN